VYVRRILFNNFIGFSNEKLLKELKEKNEKLQKELQDLKNE
jgi:hypothetical protein